MKLYFILFLSILGLNFTPLFSKLLVNNKEFLTAENVFNEKKPSFFKEKNFVSPFAAHPDRNNPFNLVYTVETANLLGCIGSDKGFCIFSKKDYGIRAGLILVQLYFEQGANTIKKFVDMFTDTNKDAYKQFFTTNLRITEDSVIAPSKINLSYIAHLITVFEGQAGKEGIPAGDLKESAKYNQLFREIDNVQSLNHLRVEHFYRDRKIEETNNNNNNENISN